jgi:hypothetical protein
VLTVREQVRGRSFKGTLAEGDEPSASVFLFAIRASSEQNVTAP